MLQQCTTVADGTLRRSHSQPMTCLSSSFLKQLACDRLRPCGVDSSSVQARSKLAADEQHAVDTAMHSTCLERITQLECERCKHCTQCTRARCRCSCVRKLFDALSCACRNRSGSDLREAGRRKLEEFKRRNVESLPTQSRSWALGASAATGLAPLTGPPMATMAACRPGCSRPHELGGTLASPAMAISTPEGPRGATSDGALRCRPRLAAQTSRIRRRPAMMPQLAQIQRRGHQHDSAPVSRASSTNSAILQGDLRRHAHELLLPLHARKRCVA